MSTVADLTVTPEPEDVSERPRRRGLGLALAIIGGAQLMIVLDGTIVNIALPHIQTALGFSESQPVLGRQRVRARAGQPAPPRRAPRRPPGPAQDVRHRRAALRRGLARRRARRQRRHAASAPASLQGMGAALASPAALALITTTFPAGKDRNRAMGVYAAMSGVGAAVGLILGGALTEYDWRWTFFINVPIGLLVAFLAPRVLVESERGPRAASTSSAPSPARSASCRHRLRPDPRRVAHRRVDLADHHRLAHRRRRPARRLRRRRARATRTPLLPIRIIADRTRGVSLFVMLVVGAGMFAMFYFLGLYIQQVLGYAPAEGRLRVPAVLVRPWSSAPGSPRRSPVGSTRAGSPAPVRCSRRPACGASPT